MILIIGLGNPGRQHENNRHNIGYMALDHLAGQHNKLFVKNKHNAMITCVNTALLVKPLTGMNLSGNTVKGLVEEHNLLALKDPKIIVLYDDLTLPLGEADIRTSKMSGSHNGVRSIISSVPLPLVRVRIGIGNKPEGVTTLEHVLSDFKASERPLRDQGIINAVTLIGDYVK